MEFRKMVMITLYAKQKKRHRCTEQSFWLWEKARVGCFERIALKHVYYLGWNRSPAQAGCMRQVLGPDVLGKPKFLFNVLYCLILLLGLKSILSLLLHMELGSALISFLYMYLSSFPRTTCWKVYLFSIVYSCFLCHRLVDQTFVGLPFYLVPLIYISIWVTITEMLPWLL